IRNAFWSCCDQPGRKIVSVTGSWEGGWQELTAIATKRIPRSLMALTELPRIGQERKSPATKSTLPSIRVLCLGRSQRARADNFFEESRTGENCTADFSSYHLRIP